MKPDYEGNNWAIYNADCVELLMGLPDDSIDCSVFSSPFSSLYIYSDSERDMGNSCSTRTSGRTAASAQWACLNMC